MSRLGNLGSTQQRVVALDAKGTHFDLDRPPSLDFP